MAQAVAISSSAPAETRSPALVGAFMFGHFTHHVTNTLLSPLLPLIRDSFGLSYAQSGFLVSAFSVTGGLSQAPIGALADRVGSRTVMTAGLLVSALFCFLIGLAGGYWQLLLALVGLGAVAGSYHAPANTLLSQIFPRARLGGVLGMHTVGGNLSFFATPLLAGGLAAVTLTWRTPYLAFAIAPLLAGLALIFVLPRGPERVGASASPAAVFRELRGVFGLIGPLVSLAVIYQMTYAAALAFLALYLVDARGFEATTAAFFVSIPYIGGLLGSPLGGGLSDRLGRKPVIIASMVLLGPLFLLVTLVPTEAIIPALALVGLVSSARQPVIEGLILDRAPAERKATTLGAYYFVGQEFGGLAAPALGALATIAGIGQAFIGIGVALAAVSGAVFVVHRKL
jgi:FSR family fosmidomycin resistance protein-like MFS transporter